MHFDFVGAIFQKKPLLNLFQLVISYGASVNMISHSHYQRVLRASVTFVALHRPYKSISRSPALIMIVLSTSMQTMHKNDLEIVRTVHLNNR